MLKDKEFLKERKRQEKRVKNKGFKIQKVDYFSAGKPSDILYVCEDAEIKISYSSEFSSSNIFVGLELYSQDDMRFISTLSNKHCRKNEERKLYNVPINLNKGKGAFSFKFSPLLLGPESYTFHFTIFSKSSFDQSWITPMRLFMSVMLDSSVPNGAIKCISMDIR